MYSLQHYNVYYTPYGTYIQAVTTQPLKAEARLALMVKGWRNSRAGGPSLFLGDANVASRSSPTARYVQFGRKASPHIHLEPILSSATRFPYFTPNFPISSLHRVIAFFARSVSPGSLCHPCTPPIVNFPKYVPMLSPFIFVYLNYGNFCSTFVL